MRDQGRVADEPAAARPAAPAPAGPGAVPLPPPGAAGEGPGAEEAAVREALTLALRWLGRRARTAREIAGRLRERGFADPVIGAALARLARWGYVDDGRLARDQAEAAPGRHIGPRRLRAELLRRGVAPAVVDGAVAEAWPPGREREQARQLARRRWARIWGEMERRHRSSPAEPAPWQGGGGAAGDGTAGAEAGAGGRAGAGVEAERRRAAGRLFRYLVGRGFSAQVAEEVVRELLEETAAGGSGPGLPGGGDGGGAG
ncbi:hypothetical protein JCM13210_04200 [Thermaerobacter litoralis]